MSIKRTFLMVVTVALAVVGCSDSNDKKYSTNAINVEVTAGQQDISKALIRSSEVLVTGLLNESNDGILSYQSFYTQDNGTAKVVIFPGKIQLFELVTLPANKEINQAASFSRCQWVEGCDEGKKKFGEDINPAYQWQSVVWDLRKDERIVVTPLTHLAAALAFEYAYAETPEDGSQTQTNTPEWQPTGYYSPYSVEQAISQVSKLFKIGNVQTEFPADLTRINSLNTKDPVSAKNSIRYGAILAAWAHLQESTPGFTNDATQEFLDNKAQIVQKDSEDAVVQSTLTLEVVYTAAKNNLENLPINNAGIKTLVDNVIIDLNTSLSTFDNELTDVRPETIKELFGDNAFNDYELGVGRTKLFVKNLIDTTTKLIDSEYFFGEEYDTELKSYIDQQKLFFENNKAHLNGIVSQLNDAQKIYIDSYLTSSCANVDAYPWIKECNYKNTVLILTDLRDHAITLEMKNFEGNVQAIDIEMKGELLVNKLIFKLKDTATNKSRVRLFYAQPTNVIPTATNPVIGYEYQWADFTFYDVETKDTEFTGNFSLLYRGVVNPDNSKEIHFNIDTLRLSSRISDHIGGTDKDDKEASSVFIAAKSSTADTYYNPAEEFGKINGFFTEQSVNAVQDIAIEGLVSYKLGEELIHNQTVKYFDFYIHDESAQSFRYRFYPDVVRNQNAAGQYTVGNNDAIITHKMAVCPLTSKTGEWKVDGTCSPAQIFNGKRDVQKSINTFWQAGVFSYIDLPGKGEYFVEWPATNKNGCFELDKLSETAQTITEPAKLVSAAVLGLDTLRVTTEVMLEKQPRTLLDVLISAPKEERYNVTAALSHKYNPQLLSEDKVIISNDNSSDRILVNYNTDSSFKRLGSFSVYKSGVTLFEGDSAENAELMLGLNQSYVGSYTENNTGLPHKYITGSNGSQQLCVTANKPFEDRDINKGLKDDAIYSLAFRGVVYGSIRKENSMWIARFIDGTWIPLVP